MARMRRILVTGGTVFVSRYAAGYFVCKGYAVHVLNRNTRPEAQVRGASVIQCDRHDLRNRLGGMGFDFVLDMTAYNAADVGSLLDALGGFGGYILLNSGAVYPESLPRPFRESFPTGRNAFWQDYGEGKAAAEDALLGRFPDGYVVRPAYLYGPMNNIYREAFVFDCAERRRPFFLPGDGSMGLQFLHVDDLCRLLEAVMERRPAAHVINAGNERPVSVREWVSICYGLLGQAPSFVRVDKDVPWRNFFPFHDYDYLLDVSSQAGLIGGTRPLAEGLADSLRWYKANPGEVRRRPLLGYIDRELSHLLSERGGKAGAEAMPIEEGG